MKNSFNDMQEEHIRSFYNNSRDRKIRTKINSSLGTMRFLGQIADVYVSRFVKTMTKLASNSEVSTEVKRGDIDDSNNRLNQAKYPNL